MLLENLYCCQTCYMESIISQSFPENAKFVASIHQCPNPICNNFILVVSNITNPGIFLWCGLDKSIMQQKDNKEKKIHMAQTLSGMLDEENGAGRDYLEIEESDVIMMSNIHLYIGDSSILLSAEELDEVLANKTLITKQEEIDLKAGLACLLEGKLPWEKN